MCAPVPIKTTRILDLHATVLRIGFSLFVGRGIPQDWLDVDFVGEPEARSLFTTISTKCLGAISYLCFATSIVHWRCGKRQFEFGYPQRTVYCGSTGISLPSRFVEITSP